MSDGAKYKLVFVNGWGFGQENWHTFFERFDCFGAFEYIDLDQACSVDEWCESIAARTDHETILVGWSLGGMLSALSVAASGARPRALVCLMSNLRFENGNGWAYGVRTEDFEALQNLLDSSSKKALSRFSTMAVQGSEHARKDLRSLKPSNFSHEVLGSGLSNLREIDLRSSCLGNVPHHWLYGQNDSLVPNPGQIVSSLPAGASYEVLEGVAHLPMLSAADQVAASINHFIIDLESDLVA